MARFREKYRLREDLQRPVLHRLNDRERAALLAHSRLRELLDRTEGVVDGDKRQLDLAFEAYAEDLHVQKVVEFREWLDANEKTWYEEMFGKAS